MFQTTHIIGKSGKSKTVILPFRNPTYERVIASVSLSLTDNHFKETESKIDILLKRRKGILLEPAGMDNNSIVYFFKVHFELFQSQKNELVPNVF